MRVRGAYKLPADSDDAASGSTGWRIGHRILVSAAITVFLLRPSTAAAVLPLGLACLGYTPAHDGNLHPNDRNIHKVSFHFLPHMDSIPDLSDFWCLAQGPCLSSAAVLPLGTSTCLSCHCCTPALLRMWRHSPTKHFVYPGD